jgi:polysaccharide biosynthesis transport protein
VSTSRNPDSADFPTITALPPSEHPGGELVPVGSYPMAPYSGTAWPAGPAPRPEMLSAAPDPMSLLRAYRRRWPLAMGLGIIVAFAAMAASWYLIPQKGEVFAYVQVMRNPETMVSNNRPEDSYAFITLRNTTIELMKSKSLLTRALRDASIAQLPLIKKQTDPVEWLQDELNLKYPNDAELLQITMSGEDIDQIVAIVNAVVHSYFKEVVEKEVQERNKKEQKLKAAVSELNEDLIRQKKDVDKLQSSLGIVEASMAAQQTALIQAQLGMINNSIFSGTAEMSNLEVKIDEYKLDIALAQDPQAKEARAEEEMHKDDRMKKLEEDLSGVELFIADLSKQVKTKENGAIKRAEQRRNAVEDKISMRREELMKKFSDSNEAIKVKEFQGKLAASEKHRDAVKERLDVLKKERDELHTKLQIITRDTAELDTRKQNLRTQQLFLDSLNADLARINLEKQAPQRVKQLDDAIAPSGTPIKRKLALVAFSGFAGYIVVGLAVAFYEFLARRISSSTQLADGLGLRIVGALPSISRPGRKALAAANGDLNRLLVESIDTVRTNLIHSAVSEPTRVVMITSALDREGKTTVASQLAASLARCGRRTLLVDGDLRRPTAHRLFELPLEPGLCEVLRGEAEIDDVIRPTRVAGLWMISAGQYDLESIQALSKEGVGEVFDVLRSRFDFVVVDSAPVLSIADSSMMGQHVDAAILCVMREVSQAAKVYEASEQLRAVGVNVLGAVINGERTAATYRAYSAQT